MVEGILKWLATLLGVALISGTLTATVTWAVKAFAE